MKLIVCGTRTIRDEAMVERTIDHYVKQIGHEITELVHGDCRGVDTFAGNWAKKRGIMPKPFPAKWQKTSAPGTVIKVNARGERYNANAGFDRNEAMAQYVGKDGYMIAIRADGKSNGTDDMIERAKKHGIVTIVVHVREREERT